MDLENYVLNIVERLKNGDKTIENISLDIKGEWYSNMSKDSRWQDEFAKDVCGIANNLEEEIGYLIFGIMEHKEPYLNSVSINEDEANIQQIISDQLSPTPFVNLSSIEVKGNNILVISIKSEKEQLPYFALKKQDNRHYIYVRKGSRVNLCTRQDLLQILRAKREKEIDIEIEAKALSNLKKLEYKSRRNLDFEEDSLNTFLDEIEQYSEDYGDRVSIKILTILINISAHVRFGGINEISPRLVHIASNTLYFVNFKFPRKKELSANQIFLLERIIDLGHNLGYDGARRLQSNKVINAGLNLLWRTLRFAHLNNYTDIKNKSEKAFKVVENWTERMNLEDANRWTQFRKKDALAINDEPLPDYPKDIKDELKSY